MRTALTAVFGLVVAVPLVVLVACGSDGSNGTPPDGGASSGDGNASSSSGGTGSSSGGCGTTPTGGIDLATYATRLCGAFTPCCPKYGHAIDDAKCIKNNTTAANDLVFDPIKAEECVNAWEANAKTDTFCQSTPSPPVCLDVWKRCATAGGPGSPCKDRYDCALSSEGTVDCEKAKVTDPTGICRLEVRAKVGEDCNAGARRIGDRPGIVGTVADPTRLAVCYSVDGLYCDSDTRKCTANIAVGEVCELSDPCIDGAICEPADGGGRRCEAAHVAGETCDESRDCATGLYCDTTKKCAQKKPASSACEKFDACLQICESGTCVDKPSINIPYLFFCGPKDGG
jgi:hypothetical protein